MFTRHLKKHPANVSSGNYTKGSSDFKTRLLQNLLSRVSPVFIIFRIAQKLAKVAPEIILIVVENTCVVFLSVEHDISYEV